MVSFKVAPLFFLKKIRVSRCFFVSGLFFAFCILESKRERSFQVVLSVSTAEPHKANRPTGIITEFRAIGVGPFHAVRFIRRNGGSRG